jgi:hypothetical protein
VCTYVYNTIPWLNLTKRKLPFISCVANKLIKSFKCTKVSFLRASVSKSGVTAPLTPVRQRPVLRVDEQEGSENV